MAYMLTSHARIFIAPAGSGCGKHYNYYTCMKMGGLDRSAGETTPIYCPDPSKAGRFRQVQVVKASDGAWTSTITGYKPAGMPSVLARLARERCKFDLQVHFGVCNDLSNFSDFEQALVFENVEISSYNIDGLGALNSSETAPVMETVNITAANVYELFTVGLVHAAGNQVALGGQVPAVAYSPYDCVNGDAEACQNFYALQLPLTFVEDESFFYILASNDGGLSWTRHETDAPAAIPEEYSDSLNIAVANNHIILSGDATGVLYGIPVTRLDAATTEYNNTVTLGAMVTRLKRMRSRVYGVTENGKVFWVRPSTMAVYYIEDGSLYTNRWNDFDGLDYDNFLVVGDSGTLAVRRNGTSLRTVPINIDGSPIADDITAVAMKGRDDWVIGTENGAVYCTSDAGVTWSLIFTSQGSVVRRVLFPTNSRGYIVLHSPANVYTTSDGGSQWTQIEAVTTGLSTYSLMKDFVACPLDPTIFVAVGHTADDESAYYASETAVSYGDLSGFVIIGD